MAWEVELEVHPAAPEAALEALPWLDGQLTSSNLDTRQLPAGAAAALRRLPALRALRLGAAHVAAACVDARARLSRLSRLELEASFFPLPGLTQLAACASLAALRLVDDSQRGESLLLPPPASFRAGRGLLPLSSRGLCVRLCLALRDEVVRHSRLLPASLAGAMLPAAVPQQQYRCLRIQYGRTLDLKSKLLGELTAADGRQHVTIADDRLDDLLATLLTSRGRCRYVDIILAAPEQLLIA